MPACRAPHMYPYSHHWVKFSIVSSILENPSARFEDPDAVSPPRKSLQKCSRQGARSNASGGGHKRSCWGWRNRLGKGWQAGTGEAGGRWVCGFPEPEIPPTQWRWWAHIRMERLWVTVPSAALDLDQSCHWSHPMERLGPPLKSFSCAVKSHQRGSKPTLQPRPKSFLCIHYTYSHLRASPTGNTLPPGLHLAASLLSPKEAFSDHRFTWHSLPRHSPRWCCA